MSSDCIMEYRKDYGIPNSDAFEAEPLNRWDMIEDGIRSVKNFEF